MQNWLVAQQRHVTAQIQQVQQELSALGCAALLGEFRMGKTPTLEGLLKILEPPRCYVSLAELASEHPGDSAPHFYRQVLRGLAEDWGGKPPKDVQLELPGRDMDGWGKYNWFESNLVKLSLRPITILVDDAERFADLLWGRRAFLTLPDLMGRARNVRIVLAGTNRLEKWAEGLRDSTGKAGLWDLIQKPVVLRPIPRETVENAFLGHRRLARRLIKLCGGHPYCLRQLTEELRLRGRSPDRLIESVDARAADLDEEWDKTFNCYWQAYDGLTRQLCFLLTVAPDGLTPQELGAKLPPGGFDRGVEAMRNTGVLFEDSESGLLCLIELFRRWYKKEIGFVEGELVTQAPTPVPPASPAPPPKATPTTELTFLPQHDLVLIRRDRFLFSSKFNVPHQHFFQDIQFEIEQTPADDGQQFDDNIKRLSRGLRGQLIRNTWFEELVDSVNARHRLRFNIPKEMSAFPFELLPLDDSGTKRIGMQVAISRQLFKEGHYVERAPLTLPREEEGRLRVLVVAAEVGGEVAIDAGGQVDRGMDARIGDSGETFKLDHLHLDEELQALRQILTGQSDLISEVTFLTRSDRIYETQERGVELRCALPTAEAFREALAGEQFDLLHFMGHTLRTPDNPEQGGLLFSDQLVHLSELRGLLREQRRLGFVYLSCCESGVLDLDRRISELGGLAHACVEAGVPAVLGMRWPIPVGFSLALTQAFYPAFFRTGLLDQALHLAVRKIYEQERDLSKKVYAAAPVLILH